MNDNMIERVARAILAVFEPDLTWADLTDFDQNFYKYTDTVAIQAMREPTDAMIKAGFESISASCDINPAELRIAWQVMIDSILSENNPK